jgi:putative tricarboxylic transport membrane protein
MHAKLRHLLPHGLMLLASVLLYLAATKIDANTGGGSRIGPDVWPKAIIVFMGLLCAWELVKRALRGAPAAAGEAPAAAKPLKPAPLAGGIALVVGYVFVVPWMGFFLATALFLAGFSWIGGSRRPGLVAAVSLAGSLILVVLFMRVAYISLPLGENPFQQLSLLLLRLIGVT